MLVLNLLQNTEEEITRLFVDKYWPWLVYFNIVECFEFIYLKCNSFLFKQRVSGSVNSKVT